MEKIQGIYQIRNLINGNVYMGSSVNIKKRWGQHLLSLKRSNHINSHLQNAWNKYGEDKFIFEKIEDVLKEKDLKSCEQWFLNRLKVNDYNITRDSSSPMRGRFGKDNSFYGKHHTYETKEKISKANKGRKHTKETKRKMSKSRTGIIHSLECRYKLSLAHSGESCYNSKLTNDEVLEIRNIYPKGKHTLKQLGKYFDVSGATISRIINRKIWKYI